LHVQCDNGIEATIYPPEYVAERMIERHGDEAFLVVDGRPQYSLITSTADPEISNRGDGSFHPMSVDAVVAALRAIRLDNAAMRIRVLVLPYPRREVIDSSARDNMVLLSPGVGDFDPATSGGF
jgi:hypothetical protein